MGTGRVTIAMRSKAAECLLKQKPIYLLRSCSDNSERDAVGEKRETQHRGAERTAGVGVRSLGSIVFTVNELPSIDGYEEDQARQKLRKETVLPHPTIAACRKACPFLLALNRLVGKLFRSW